MIQIARYVSDVTNIVVPQERLNTVGVDLITIEHSERPVLS